MASSIDKINALTEKYGLSETVKLAIIEISKEAYCSGVHSVVNQIVKHGK